VARRIVSQGHIMRDDLTLDSLLSIAEKNDQNNAVHFSERTSSGAGEILLAPSTI